MEASGKIFPGLCGEIAFDLIRNTKLHSFFSSRRIVVVFSSPASWNSTAFFKGGCCRQLWSKNGAGFAEEERIFGPLCNFWSNRIEMLAPGNRLSNFDAWESSMTISCGIGELTRSSSFRNSLRRQREPLWIQREYKRRRKGFIVSQSVVVACLWSRKKLIL